MTTEYSPTDFKLIARFGLSTSSRYRKLTPEVRDTMVNFCYDVANGKIEATLKQRQEAVNCLRQIDKLEMEHEKMHTPKVEVKLSELTDSQLQDQIAALEKEMEKMVSPAYQEKLLYDSIIQEEKEKESEAIYKGEKPDEEAGEVYDPGKDKPKFTKGSRSVMMRPGRKSAKEFELDNKGNYKYPSPLDT